MFSNVAHVLFATNYFQGVAVFEVVEQEKDIKGDIPIASNTTRNHFADDE